MNNNAHLPKNNNGNRTKTNTKGPKKAPAKPRPKPHPKPPTSDATKAPEKAPAKRSAKAPTKALTKPPTKVQNNGHPALVLDTGLAPRPAVAAIVVPVPAGPAQPAPGAKILYCADEVKNIQPPAAKTTAVTMPASAPPDQPAAVAKITDAADKAKNIQPPPAGKPTPRTLHPKVRCLSDYLQLPKNDPNALCSMFSAGELVMVGGFTGQGKSTLFGPQLGLCAAAGADWFGLKFLAPYKVLVIGFENTPHRQLLGTLGAMRQLFPLWTEEQRQSAEQNYSDFMLCDAHLDDTDDNRPGIGFAFIAWLRAILSANPRKLVILDCYAAFCGCAFVDQEATSTFLRQGLQSVATQFGCVIIVIHHFGKPSKDSIHAGSELGFGPLMLFNGTSDMQNQFRGFIALMPTPYCDDDGQRVFALRTDKRTIPWRDKEGHQADKSGRPYKEMWVRWSPKIWSEHGLYAWEHSPLTPDMSPNLELKAAIAAKAQKDALKSASKGN